MSRRPFADLLLILSLSLVASLVQAQPFPEESLPPALKAWVPWALDGAEDRLCPVVGGGAVCLWPGRLAFDATAQGARFALDAYADRALDLPLPGGERRWPQDVQLDGKPAVVLVREGAPAVRLTRGSHRLDGRFAWDRLPDSLAVPAAIALLDLTVEGRAVSSPRRDESGLLLLRQGGASDAGGENLDIKVFRHVADGIPLWIETRLRLDVSGRAREVSLAGALLPGSSPVAVSGDLPARLDADGRLRIQVRAGSFSVRVLARVQGRPDRIAPLQAVPPWPGQEVWVFAAAERLRQVEVSGATPIDPSRTDLPEEWRPLRAYLIEEGSGLALKELRRGEPDAPPDQLRLTRTLWLDERGSGFTVRDAMGGGLGRTTRLELLAPGELGRLAVGGEAQLVTRDPRSGLSGVELRGATLNVEADSRLPRSAALAAVGWDLNVQSLGAELRLPPGWRLLAATGVDRAPGSWLGSWDLYAFFFVILTALAAGKLLGRRWGAAALLTVALLHNEAGAPRLVWLFLLGALALQTAAPPGMLRKLAQAAWIFGLIVLVFALVPFAVDQVRGGLFPQVAREAGAPVAEGTVGAALGGVMRGRTAALPPAQAVPAAPPATSVAALEETVTVTGETPEVDKLSSLGYVQNGPVKKAKLPREAGAVTFSAPSEQKAYQQDPHAVIQTGSGVPSWSWASYLLVWSGPVAKDQKIRLLLLSPWMNLLLALARVVLATLLALRIVAGVLPDVMAHLRVSMGPPATAATLLLFLLSTAAASADEEAKKPQSPGGLLPSQEMLAELRDRLLRAPACAPDCVTTARLHLAVDGGQLHIAAEVHAGATAAWPVPGPAGSWVPRSVSVDGRSSEGALARLGDGFLHLRLGAGIHQIDVAGPLPPKDSLTLQFGSKARRVTASAPGWQVDGIREDGSADDSLQLSRRLSGASAAAGSGGSYEPWLEITRVLEFGVSWNVETIVRRVSPTGDPVVVKVPLPKGMLVTDAERQVKNGELLASLGRDQTEARWSATLKPAEGEAVTLVAPEGKPWSEVWVVHCGLVWQCEAAGLPPVARYAGGRLAPEFRPWPGEKLALTLKRPSGALGQTLTIDRASLHVVPGLRIEDASLELDVRASRPGPLTVTLPEGAEIQSLKIKGSDRPIRPEGSKLTLGLDAGAQPVKIAWRRSGGLGAVHRVRAVTIDHPAVNAQVSVTLPEGRWLLLTGGPSWGPALLFWGYLICILLAAFVLSRAPLRPLSAAQWFLLALGVTQIPLAGALIVAGWFLVFAWRRDRVLATPALHNLMQLALGLWTLVALSMLFDAVRQGLLLHPDMQVVGGGSSSTLLQWYQDRIDGALPRPWLVSLPLWVYRLLMLSWSLWLALSLIRWAPWAWGCFSSGSLWQRRPKPPRPPAQEPAASGAAGEKAASGS